MDRLRQRADFLAVADGARAGGTAFVLQSRGRDDFSLIAFSPVIARISALS